MNNKKIALISSLILAVGVFLPIIKTPFGSIGFFSNVKVMAFWEGLLLLLIAAVNGYLFFKDKAEKTKILSSLTLILVIVDLLINHLRIIGVKTELMKEIRNEQFAEIAESVVKNIGLSWAWIFLLVGSIGMFYASFETQICKLFSKIKFKKTKITPLNTSKENTNTFKKDKVNKKVVKNNKKAEKPAIKTKNTLETKAKVKSKAKSKIKKQTKKK